MGSVQEFLKEGTKYLTGLEEAIITNIEASKKLSEVTRTSLGPNGMNKMVVNKMEKLFITTDAITIMKELDVIHPAAKMLVLASQMQEQEVGDGTNLVSILAGEFLSKAESLLRMGLHPSEIVSGYRKASEKTQTLLSDLSGWSISNVKDKDEVMKALNSVISSKLCGYESVLVPLVADACIQVCPENPKNFNVDTVRVAKIPGGSVSDSKVVNGMLLTRGAEGTITAVTRARVAVYAVGLDIAKTETKGTVLLHNAEQLLNYSKGEEKQMEEIIKAIVDSGVNVVVCGNTIGELALHHLNRNNIMVIKSASKFEIRRLCQTVGATPLMRMGAPTKEEIGSCTSVAVEQMGNTSVTLFRQYSETPAAASGDGSTVVPSYHRSQIATIVVRAAANNTLDDIERGIDDCVNVYKQMVKDPRFVPGAGASELEVARRLLKLAESTSSLDQHAIRRFGESFEVVARTLGETSGANVTALVTALYNAHEKPDGESTGVDYETGGILNAAQHNIWDHLLVKQNAVRLAADAAITILQIDQLIMAKRAGGPKPPDQGARDED